MTAILIVERDQAACDFMTDALEMGLLAAVECEHSGKSGLKAIEGGCFDLAIIDVNLTEVSGLELAQKAANRNIPALLCGGGADAVSKAKALDLPHLSNPFHADELISTAAQILILNTENIRKTGVAVSRLRATVARLQVDLETSRRLIEQSKSLVERATMSLSCSNGLTWSVEPPTEQNGEN